MRRLASSLLATTVLMAVVAMGCGPEGDDAEPAVLPKKVAFEGKVDPKYVGSWATADGGSKLQLAKGGALKIATTTPSPKGISTSQYEGQWLATEGELLLRYLDASTQETTLGYSASLSGNTLVLRQPGGRLKTTYIRK